MTKPESPGPEALYLGRQNEHTTQRQHMLAWLESLKPQATARAAWKATANGCYRS